MRRDVSIWVASDSRSCQGFRPTAACQGRPSYTFARGSTSRGKLQLGKETFSAEHHVPLLIYPNPLNPKRYVVLNSGFTFREADWTSNARQTPKLPDWAIVDTTVPADARWPGKIVSAGFFNEDWR